MKNLQNMVDVDRFLAYMDSAKLTNAELNLVGLNLQRSADAHDFVRNISGLVPPDKEQFIADALLHSAKKGGR